MPLRSPGALVVPARRWDVPSRTGGNANSPANKDLMDDSHFDGVVSATVPLLLHARRFPELCGPTSHTKQIRPSDCSSSSHHIASGTLSATRTPCKDTPLRCAARHTIVSPILNCVETVHQESADSWSNLRTCSCERFRDPRYLRLQCYNHSIYLLS